MIAIVQTEMSSSNWTAFFTAVTPLVLLFSLWVQRIWAARTIKLAEAAAAAAAVVKNKLESYDKELRVSLNILQQGVTATHLLVNSQRGIILKNMSLLARNHATMARAVASKTGSEGDLSVAHAAELAALSAESDYSTHEGQQHIVDEQARRDGERLQEIAAKP